MNKLDMNLFAFVTWLEQNRHAHSLLIRENKLTINDGYEWYNYMWKIWLKNSDAGRAMMMNKKTFEQINQDNPVTRGSTALVYKQEPLNINSMLRGDNNIPDTDENITTDKNINHPRWTSTTTWDKLDTSNNRTMGKNNTVNISALREAITMYLNDVDSYGDDKQLRESIDVLHDFVVYLNATDENGEVNVAKWGDFIIQ